MDLKRFYTVHSERDLRYLTIIQGRPANALNVADYTGRESRKELISADRFNEAVGLKRLAHFPDLDVIRRSRLKKSTLFELDDAPGLTEVCDEYLQLAEQLWAGTEPLPCEPMKDRDLFDFLGFD